MVDIDNLLPHFVQENIIKVDDLEEIQSKPKTAVKVEKLLQYISGPLQAGSVKSFYTMLSIMEEHGTQATRELAGIIQSLVSGIKNVFRSNIITTGQFSRVTQPKTISLSISYTSKGFCQYQTPEACTIKIISEILWQIVNIIA